MAHRSCRQKDSDFASIWVTSNQILRLSHVRHPEVMVSKPFEKYPEKLFSTLFLGNKTELPDSGSSLASISGMDSIGSVICGSQQVIPSAKP